jgi:ATP-binding cassette subfamily B protein
MSRPTNMREALPAFMHTARRFAPYLKKEVPLLGGATLAMLGEVAFRLLEPWPLKWVFDSLLTDTTTAPANTVMLLTVAAGAVVAATGLRALSAYGAAIGFALAGNRVLAKVRHDLFRHLQKLSLSYHYTARNGDLTMRLVSDVGMTKEVIVTAVMPMVVNVLILVGMIGVMFWMNAALALRVVLLMPLILLITSSIGQKIHDNARKQRKREGALAATASETMGAIKVVQAYALEDHFAEQFEGQNEKELKEGVKGKRLAASLERSVDIVTAIGLATVLWSGSLRVLQGEMTPGDLLVFITYMKNAFRPLRDLAKYTARLSKATAAGERLMDILDTQEMVVDAPTAKPAPPLHGGIRFSDVSFAYEESRLALDDVSFKIEAGQKVALVGPSGHGKSTIMSLLLRLYEPETGLILLDGKDFRRYTIESVRSQMSVVLQDSPLFAMSVRDNIAIGAANVTDEEIERAARLANADEFIRNLPEGYDTILGERGVTLSGGQRQRLAIARAAVRNTPILILDEPITGLDESNARIVLSALEKLMEGRTTLLITHDLRHTTMVDQILYIEHGRIVESGSHADLMARGGRYAAMVQLQQHTAGEGYHALATP